MIQILNRLEKFSPKLPRYVPTLENFLMSTYGLITITPRIIIYDPSETFPDYVAQLIYSAFPNQSSRRFWNSDVRFIESNYVIPHFQYRTNKSEEISEIERLAHNQKRSLEDIHGRKAIVVKTIIHG